MDGNRLGSDRPVCCKLRTSDFQTIRVTYPSCARFFVCWSPPWSRGVRQNPARLVKVGQCTISSVEMISIYLLPMRYSGRIGTRRASTGIDTTKCLPVQPDVSDFIFSVYAATVAGRMLDNLDKRILQVN